MKELQIDLNGIYVSKGRELVYYPESGNNNCVEIENNSFWFKHRNNIIYDTISNFSFNGNFVDIGGGNGLQVQFLANMIPGQEFYLIEPGYNGCFNARKRGIDNVFNISFQEFPFEKFNIAGVGLFDVIEHIDDDVLFMNELANHLPGGSSVYITVPAYNWLWSDVDNYSQHFRRYNRKMLYWLAGHSGFTVKYFSYFFSYLLPFSFLIRSLPYRLGRRRENDEIISSEVKQHNSAGITSTFLHLAAEVERTIIKRKYSCYFGASCIVVLQKV